MRLTRKKTIALCIELWEWLAKTGKQKHKWPEWEKYGHITADCWFCENNDQQEKNEKGELTGNRECQYCILPGTESQRCFSLGFKKWWISNTDEDRKKYAALFLAQIRKCR